MKKLFLFITMLFLCITGYAYDIAVENADGKTIYYNYTNDGQELEVTDGNVPYSGSVNIPETVTFMNRTRKVTSIESFAFYYSRDITSISIPRSVTFIGKNSFEKCNKLTSVHISDISAWCKIVFEEPYTSNPLINARHLYFNDEEIKDLVIPLGITSINAGAFCGCYGLTSVSIPDGVLEIGENAFWDCRGITYVSIPSSVKSIGKRAFDSNVALTAVYISDIAAWCEIDFVGYWYWSNPLYYAHHLYVNGEEVKDLVIPDGVESIGNFAFGGCTALTSVTIPNSVNTIGEYSFDGCDIPIVASLIENPFEISSETFTQNTFKNATLYVPKGTIDKYKATNGWKEFMFISDATRYKLAYYVDNELYKSYEIEEGTTINPETEPAKEGYTFSGWSELPETMPSHDLTVTGSFSINSYKLTYIVDGVEYKTIEVEYNTTITPEAEPTKEGYTFSGWSEIPETMPANDVAVTGSFAVNTYTLTYLIDGEVYKTSQVDFGTPIVPEELPTKTGYTFSGWSEIPALMPAMDVTIKGTFTINNYKLTYVVDGVEYKTTEVEYNSEITPEAEPTKEGHTFSGWSEIPETMPANDVTIYGSFIVNKYRVTYIIDSDVYATDYVDFGAIIIPPTVEEQEGFTFSGWVDVPETMPAYDITIYGSFTSSIAEVTMATQRNVRIYLPNGKKIDRLQKGLNIVILEDGTVKKVVVK